ncbi:hypothetical protein NV226_01160 [Mycoplasma iguanae]|uniref:Fibronectin type-III domain-containing protein n=1 Tax=Mycoplasma iguanae TaxID=292461 RepID=A0ABY5R8Y2_9MOLU|nr:hypothetical protein [Mycoplasma iguanae]UVD81898.1 hypothetical protein NV226_01160 [Mycoplasma iguanae]
MNVKNKKLIGIFFAAWGVLTISTAVAVPLILRNNQKTLNSSSQFSDINKIDVSIVNISPTEVKIELNDLDNFLNRNLTLEYSPVTEVQKTSSNSSLPSQKINLFVSKESMSLLIGDLKLNTTYSLKVLSNDQPINFNNNTKTDAIVFSTYNKPKLHASTSDESIYVKSSKLNEQFLKSNINIRYKKYSSSSNSVDSFYQSAKGIVGLDAKENGSEEYVVSANLEGLQKGTAYVIYLEIEGQSSFISDPVIVWTKGGNPDAIIMEDHTFATGALGFLGGVEDYSIVKDTNTVFSVRYWETNGNSRDVKEQKIEFQNTPDVPFVLKGLKPVTEYTYILVKTENGKDSKIVSEATKNFTTIAQPTVEPVKSDLNDNVFSVIRSRFSNDLTLNVWKSASTAEIKFNKIASATNEAKERDLVAVAISEPVNKDNINWSQNQSGKVSLNNKEAKFNNLTAGKYIVQLFNKLDVNFEAPYLAQGISFEIPQPFKIFANQTELLKSQFKINVSDISNVVSGEISLVWDIKDSTDPKTRKVSTINLEENQNDFEQTISNLLASKEYVVSVFPSKADLNSPSDAFATLNFKTEDFVYIENIEATVKNPEAKFTLAGLKDTYLDKPLKFQWKNRDEDWNETNSKDFTIDKTSVNNEKYQFSLPIKDLKEIKLNNIYEFRIVEPNKTENVSQGGENTFYFNDSIYSISSVKQNFKDANLFDWHQDLDVKKATSWNAGRAPSGTKWGDTAYTYGGMNGTNQATTVAGIQTGKTVDLAYLFGAPAKTRQEWLEIYQFLAFKGTEAKQKEMADQFSYAYWFNVGDNITSKYKVLPYATDSTEPARVSSNDFYGGIYYTFLGGLGPQSDLSATPKSSDFINQSWKISSLEGLGKALLYKLYKIKEHGFDMNNRFIKNKLASKQSDIYASQVNSIDKLKGYFNLSSATSSSFKFELATPLDNEKNIFANDVEGRLYYKVSVKNNTDNAEQFTYWTYIPGFKKPTAATANDVKIERRLDSLSTPLILEAEFKLLKTQEQKNAFINNHFLVDVPYIYDWEVNELTKINDEKVSVSLTLKPKDTVLGSYENHNKTEKSSLSEISFKKEVDVLRTVQNTKDLTFTYKFPGDRNEMASFGSPIGKYSEWSNILEYRGFILFNQTYEKLIINFKEAIIKKQNGDSTDYDDLVTKLSNLINESNSNDSFKKGQKLYIRGAHQPFFTTQTGNNSFIKEQSVLGTGTNGEIKLDYFLSDSGHDEDNKTTSIKKMVEEIVNKYGKLANPEADTPSATNPKA